MQTAELRAAQLAEAAFDLVVAVHVGSLWRPPAAEFAVVRRVLAPGGRFVPRRPARSRADRVAALATPSGLVVTAVHTGDTPPRPSIAVQLEVAPAWQVSRR